MALHADDPMVEKECHNVMQAMNKLVGRANESRRAVQNELEQFKRRVEELTKENSQLRAKVEDLTKDNATLRKGQSGGYPAHATNGVGPAVVDGEKQTSEIGGPGKDGSDLFELVDGKIMLHGQNVHDVAVHRKLNVMATASWDKTVQLYDLTKKEVVRTLGTTDDKDAQMGGLYCVAFARTQDNILGCTSADNKVYLWNHEQGRMEKELAQHTDEVNGIDFHSSKHVLCSVSDDAKAIVWDFQEGIALRVLDQHTKAVYGAKFLGPTHEYNVATCCFDKETRIFDMRDKAISQVLRGHQDDVIGIDIVGGSERTDAHFLATGSDDGHIFIWDIRNWQRLYDFDTNIYFGPSKDSQNEVKRVKFSPCGKYLAAGTSKGSVLVYQLGAAQERGQYMPVANLKHCNTAGSGKVECVFGVDWGKWSNGQSFLVSGSHDHTCSHWNMNI